MEIIQKQDVKHMSQSQPIRTSTSVRISFSQSKSRIETSFRKPLPPLPQSKPCQIVTPTRFQ
ncbi:hypothetical protein KUTeg_008485 [Tegillarca granosa]|uniref:Uncharacterized protein n=1 Tax=Tegillarca granosa TaxID=220873 RepID=A0ABQ9F989_TEGGR|nr:hypothetical protein KUTeg_008485 [Tegillarca granosa]